MPFRIHYRVALPAIFLLFVLVACSTSPSSQAVSKTPMVVRITPTSTIATRTDSLQTYKGHSDGVVGLAWSADGKRIVTCSDDDTVQMWNATTGQTLWKYSPFLSNSYIFDVAESPDGKRIAAAGSKSLVWLLDATNGHLLATLDDSSGFVLGLAWSPDSKRIAIGDESGTVTVKDAASGKTLLIYKGHSGPVARITWSPDGTRIASASYDTMVQIWNATTGQHILTYSDHKAPVWSVAWSPDGKRIVSGTGASGHNNPNTTNNSIKVWDATTGKTLLMFASPSYSEAYAIAWSPDGTQVASGGDDVQVHVWNATTGQLIYQHQGQKDLIWKIAWSPDGTKIASSSQDGSVLVWSAKS